MRALSAFLFQVTATAVLSAQQPVTRAQAIAAALDRGARAAIGRSDTSAARGALHGARLYPNPSISAGYSKDPPHDHLLADVPLDLPWLRSARIGAAAAAHDAVRYGFAFERAAIRFDADTTYTLALASSARARLSRRNALDADSLLAMARLRRSVGDVSELDVRLAEVNAGQLENVALDDSIAAVDALLALQLGMGLPAEAVTITLADSLEAPPSQDTAAGSAEALPVLAAAAGLRAAERSLSLAHRSVFAAPSLEVGFDRDDPGGQSGGGLLPVFGISLPLPLFNWNGGEVAQAVAARDRARAGLDLARREADAARARARRDLAIALERLARDRRLLASADQVAAMSLRAYTEGAAALPSVIEAQRSAREALARTLDDLAAANDASAALRFVSATEEP